MSFLLLTCYNVIQGKMQFLLAPRDVRGFHKGAPVRDETRVGSQLRKCVRQLGLGLRCPLQGGEGLANQRGGLEVWWQVEHDVLVIASVNLPAA